MIVVPFIEAHLIGFEIQEEQSLINKYVMDSNYIKTISEYGEAWTCVANGEAVAIAGTFQPHDHLGMVWAILDKKCKDHMVGATRAISNWLDNYNVPRMETAIRRDFKEGQRWVNMMGFTNETPEVGMKNYGLDGETYDLYARYN